MKGFSLLELLLALAITLVVGMIGFQLFRQNALLFESQNNASAVQQNARALIFQINDEIRRTGQGVPTYASQYDSTATEPVAAILNGSDATHLLIREGYSNVQADVLTSPANYVLNVAQTLVVSDASPFYNTLGTSSPVGRFAYVWGVGSNSCWSWIRATLVTLSVAAGKITLVPQQIGQACRTAPNTVRLTAPATIALEEATSIYLNNGSIWRATAADMTNQTSPVWNASAEIGRDFDGLVFTYYDVKGNVIQPTTLAARLAVARIDTMIHAQSGLGLTMRGYPVNLRLH
jgi:prepilin-type N-terminal cleavage/methylation domain-containing protein